MLARTQLWILAFTGFMVNYMVRINLNIAIVAMVQRQKDSSQGPGPPHVAFCRQHNIQQSTNVTEVHIIATSPADSLPRPGMVWDEYEIGLVLGAFYWCHWCTQIAGGVLAQRFGTKRVFGLSQLATIILALFIPTAAQYGYKSLIALRVAQGIANGFVWPSMHTMIGRWVPPTERSKFVTSYLGSSFGAAVTLAGCGVVLERLGWQAVFYVTGTFGIIWFCAWWHLIHDSPYKHPNISLKERTYIEKSLGRAVDHTKTLRTPWRNIFTSSAVWMCILARWGGDWGLFTLLANAPTYLNNIHGLSLSMTGLLAGFPHICRLLFAMLVSAVGDKLLTSQKCTHTQLRKIATAICCLGQGLCMLGLAVSECDASLAILFLAAATTLNGAISTGPLASFVDLSPNFAGALFGLSGMISVLTGFISPTLAGLITYQNQTTDGWRLMFLVDAGMLLVPGILYVAFSSSELQTWNTPHSKQGVEEGGRKPLVKETESIIKNP